jgi:hypothetical protein
VVIATIDVGDVVGRRTQIGVLDLRRPDVYDTKVVDGKPRASSD